LSPDGRYLAFLARPEAGGPDRVWIRPLDSTHARELPGTEDALGPFWSPDSRHIAFFAGDRLKKTAIEDGPAGTPQTICDCPHAEPSGTWAPDGTVLFPTRAGLMRISSSSAGGTPEAAIRLDSSRESLHQTPQFLPDGRRFVYTVVSSDPARQGIYLGSL